MANYIYGLTVQGIQSYIFATNNLREIIGASEIIENLCTSVFKTFRDKNNIGDAPYLNAAGNIRILTSKENAQLIFTNFHKKVLELAPGLPFSQAVVEFTNESSFDKLEEKLNGQRNLPMQDFDLNCMGRLIARSTGNAGVEIEAK
jgi:hypothetical protein